MIKREGSHYHIYIEFADHRKYLGKVPGHRKLWQVEETARSYFLRDKQLYGAQVDNWAIENDEHQVISWGTY